MVFVGEAVNVLVELTTGVGVEVRVGGAGV